MKITENDGINPPDEKIKAGLAAEAAENASDERVTRALKVLAEMTAENEAEEGEFQAKCMAFFKLLGPDCQDVQVFIAHRKPGGSTVYMEAGQGSALARLGQVRAWALRCEEYYIAKGKQDAVDQNEP
jgi:ethanolamine ammonia-lyase large subunit